jgi:hypothetical protein
MEGRRNAALAAAILVVTIGSSAWMALPVAAAGRGAAPSRVPAPSQVPAEPLSPKLRWIPELTGGRTARTAAIPQIASSAPCNSAWNVVPSPNASSGRNILAGLAANAPNDVWAVGYFVNSSSVYQTLAEHWNGSSWSLVPTPNVGPGNNLLTAVTAIGPSDVWAVGLWRRGDSSTDAQPLTEHWNGNGWTVVSTPKAPNSSAPLYSVSGDAPNDVWAVGIAIAWPVDPNLGPRGHAYAFQWKGNGWTSVPTASVIAPIGGPSIDAMGLNGVKVFGPNNAWAVGDGQDFTGGSPSSPDMAFIEHWDGTSWNQVSLQTKPNGDFLIDVQGTPTDLWAVGGQNKSYQSLEDNVLIEHWTSTTNTWTEVPGATPEQSANLFGLGYLLGNNIYAVGASASFSPGPNPGTIVETDHTLIERWDGANWNLVPSWNVGTSDVLTTIAAISASDVWAAGASVVGGYPQTLTENYCAPPAVASITPSSGTVGTTVVITGSGFSRAIDVEFGTAPASTFHVDSDTQITATSPAHKAGVVDIRVTVQGISATSSADQFTYLSSRSGAAEPGTHFHGGTLPPPPPIRVMTMRLGATPRAAPVPI